MTADVHRNMAATSVEPAMAGNKIKTESPGAGIAGGRGVRQPANPLLVKSKDGCLSSKFDVFRFGRERT